MLYLLLFTNKLSEHVLICLTYIFVVHEAGVLRKVAWIRLTSVGDITTTLIT